MLAAGEPKAAAASQSLLERPEPDDTGLSGDLRVEASWSGRRHDLDLALLDPAAIASPGSAAPTRAVISARDVVSTREALALRGGKSRRYVVEVIARRGGDGPCPRRSDDQRRGRPPAATVHARGNTRDSRSPASRSSRGWSRCLGRCRPGPSCRRGR